MVFHGESGIGSANATINRETRLQVAFPQSPGFPKTMKFPNGLNPTAAFPFPVIRKHPDSLGSPASDSNPSPNPETRRRAAFPRPLSFSISVKFPKEPTASPTIHPASGDTRIVCFHNLTCLLAETIAKVEA